MGLFSSDVKERPFNVNEASTDEKLERLNVIIREANDIWASLPRNYNFWIDWNSRPAKLTVVDSVQIERNIILPR